MRNGLTLVLLCFLLSGVVGRIKSVLADDIVLGDFETGFQGWEVRGNAFGSNPAKGTVDGQMEISGVHGRGFANSFHGGDNSTGELLSKEFEINRNYVSLLLGGGNQHGLAGAELLVDGQAVRSTTGSDTEELLWHNWQVTDLVGKRAQVRIFDHATEGWGHILADHVLLCDQPKSSYDYDRLKAYRESPSYYQEKYRPQFHFTPELNWMNDPNGLVYHEGEYHLFYQHNPYGNSWGHMTWGHAVSKDLVHWEHLPIAIWEEYGQMIFSGCAVVDHQNASGFGKDGRAPLVAIYTSHQRGKQAQCLAYSNDNGRTWDKYKDNPVLDLQMQDFRDPKVFWHKPSSRWVMVVSKAIDKVLQFYSSKDLKQWELLSEFGPAGAPGKPNWECPDLFELAVEDLNGNPTGNSKWVLEVDMGDASVAGGSGGEYFIGTFDGQRFVCDDPANPFQWVDYGRDFYAPVSWSDMPDEDGRRIWIGWMNNWQTHLLPTNPWRSAMSIPRVLSLRKTEDGDHVLVQRPIDELKRLRKQQISCNNIELEGEFDLTQQMGIQGNQIEIIASLEVGTAKQVGFSVLTGAGNSTRIGYDTTTQEIYIDRRESGDVGFHEAFAGKHTAPLRVREGVLDLHLFVDASSVEVFGNQGAVVLTDRVFPTEEAIKVVAFASEGEAVLRSLDSWSLKSIWHRSSMD